ncbi:hypothetical protein Cgig2_006632 [Carnegiea gigantea]|uniref:Uncharacterized protein n=1 Tax=Carnegiea gigantea TaxID=171969 RepID=A0A9Q1GY94_9CARY|nr:hypothetical protein Cgig2_006632 [Carnegiea gigantea]
MKLNHTMSYLHYSAKVRKRNVVSVEMKFMTKKNVDFAIENSTAEQHPTKLHRSPVRQPDSGIDETDLSPIVREQALSPAHITPESSALRRSTKTSKQPGGLQDYVTIGTTTIEIHYAMIAHVKPKFYSILLALSTTLDPILFQEAIKNPKWCTTMNEELEALERNKS